MLPHGYLSTSLFPICIVFTHSFWRDRIVHPKMCRSRLRSIVFFVLHMIFVTVHLQPTMALEDRRMYCVGSLPPGEYGISFLGQDARKDIKLFKQWMGGWWSAKHFVDLSDLCIAEGNPHGNLGGRVGPSTSDCRALAPINRGDESPG
jgi:hypothetical protein